MFCYPDLLHATPASVELFNRHLEKQQIKNTTVPAGLARKLLATYCIDNMITDGFLFRVEEERAVYKLYFC